jgi:hypothetical protein
MKVAEMEFAFRFGENLPPRAQAYSQAEVWRGWLALHPAIELPDSRYRHFETGWRVAAHRGQCLRPLFSCWARRAGLLARSRSRTIHGARHEERHMQRPGEARMFWAIRAWH